MDIIPEDNNNEEPKYIVLYDTVITDDSKITSSATFKAKDGVIEQVHPKQKEFTIKFKDRKVFTKEELKEQYKEHVDTGGSFWDFFKPIGNSNIYHFDLMSPWHVRYHDAAIWQSYRDLGDGWYILITINKESGIVAVFKIFDKEFDINSDADTKGDMLHLYTGEPKDIHEVEQVIKVNLNKNLDFVN